MKMCADEIQKQIKYLNEQIDLLAKDEYTKASSILVDGKTGDCRDFNFLESSRNIMDCYKKIAELKHILNTFNTTTKLDGFDYTIDEGLVRLALYNKRKEALEMFMNRKKVDTKISANTVYTIELNYDPEQVKEYHDLLAGDISKLQTAINRANLVYEIEVPD